MAVFCGRGNKLIQLLIGIQTLFNDIPALTAIFPNGCFLSHARNAEPLPTCVLTLVTATPDFQTQPTCLLNTVQVQFSVWATTDTVALNAIGLIKAHFDFVTLTLGDEYELTDISVGTIRKSEGILAEDEQTYHAFVTYEFLITEDVGQVD